MIDTYGGPAALPAVVAGKCDSADCVTPTDITAIKSCFTDPSTNECTSKAQPELKTEEGYSADIYPWRDICPHYVRQTSREGYMLLSYWS